MEQCHKDAIITRHPKFVLLNYQIGTNVIWEFCQVSRLSDSHDKILICVSTCGKKSG